MRLPAFYVQRNQDLRAGENGREEKRRSMIFLPRSGLQAGWSEGDRWTYQKVTRVWVSPRITSWYFSSTTRPLITICLRAAGLQDWLQVSSRLANWTIETLFLTLDHSPRTSHLPPQRWAIPPHNKILLTELYATVQTLPPNTNDSVIIYSFMLKWKNKNV